MLSRSRVAIALPLLLAALTAHALPGDLDTAFGTSGYADLGGSSGLEARITALRVDVDGSVLALGESFSAPAASVPTGCFVLRVRATGTLDTGFGSAGRVDVLQAQPQGEVNCVSLALLADGGMLVALSESAPGQARRPAFVRLRSDGSLDAGFAAAGIYRPADYGQDGVAGEVLPIQMEVLDSGEALAVASMDTSRQQAWAFQPQGAALPSRFARRLVTAGAGGLVPRADGDLDAVDPTYGALLRLAPDFSPRQGFGDLFDDRGYGRSALRQPDGAVLVAAGVLFDSAAPQRGLLAGRFTAQGQRDAAFNFGPLGTGNSVIDLSSRGYQIQPSALATLSTRLAFLPSGSSVQVDSVRGLTNTALEQGAVAVRRPNGGPETTFAVGGVRLLAAPGADGTRAHGLAVDTQGRILVAGVALTAAGRRPWVARLIGDGVAPRWDTEPDAPAFATRTGTARGVHISSDEVTISGLGGGVQVPIRVFQGEYQVNGTGWKRGPAWIRNGDRLQLRHVSALEGLNTTTTLIELGGLQDPGNARRSIGTTVFASFSSTTADPLPGLKCSEHAFCTPSQPIPDNAPLAPVQANLNWIADCPFVTAIRVGLEVRHSFVGDLVVTVRPPQGPAFALIDRPRGDALPGAGNCAENDIVATFEAGDLPNAQAGCGRLGSLRAIDGSVRPGAGFPGVIGGNGRGVWQLAISDRAAGDTGTLEDWSLDLSCSPTPPALSDLRVGLTPPTQLTAGEDRRISLVIHNDGPARASFGRAQAVIDVDPTSGFPSFNPRRWSCDASPGSSCSLPPDCPPEGCSTNAFLPALDIAAGGSVQLHLDARPDAFLDAGDTVGVELVASVAAALGGSVDPDTGNNRLRYERQVDVVRDLAVGAASLTRVGNEIEIGAEFSNLGPSAELGSGTLEIRVPSGYIAISSARCERGSLPCSGQIEIDSGATPVIRLRGSRLAPGASPERLVVRAVFGGTAPPQAAIEVVASTGANDPDTGNNRRSLSPAAPPSGDAIFANGFE